VVASPCCGDVWCWQCAVERPALDTRCPCGRELALEDFRPAKAIQALLKRAAATTTSGGGVVWPRPYAEIAHDDLLPCPESCGAVVRADRVEDHLKENVALHLEQLHATVEVRLAFHDRHYDTTVMAILIASHC
jgi:hypothetical protein